MEAICRRLDAIEAKLDRVLNKPAPESISIEECMLLTGCKTKRAQFRWNKKYGIKPYCHGKYRRISISNAVISLDLFGAAPKAPESI